jgi:hypothetical protein
MVCGLRFAAQGLKENNILFQTAYRMPLTATRMPEHYIEH